jgi:flagellar FliL protein
MADDEVEVEVAEAAQRSGGGLIKKLIMAAAGIVLLAIGVFGGPLVLNMLAPADDGAVEDEVALVESKPADGPALYQSLLPPLVINIYDANGDPHFMQMSMEAMARDQDVVNKIREHAPVIRNNLILLYGSASYESVNTREGKQKLLNDGLAEIQAILKPDIGSKKVEALYFTALVVQ